MTDTDLIARAAQALRTAHAGQREGSGFTRARILVTAQKRKRRWLRWLVGAPFGALLLAGSAWAQGSGQWPRLWHALAVVFVPSATLSSRSSARQPALPRAAARAPTMGVIAATPVEASPAQPPEQPEPAASEPLPHEPPDDSGPSALTVAPAMPPASDPEQPSRETRAPRRSANTSARPVGLAPATGSSAASAHAAAAGATESVARAADPELSAFRRAHDLHFAGAEPRAAIQAFAEYLAAYPEGRFVPEARYNTALDWLKLGDKAHARQSLEPFARGNYDGYRRDEATRLLEALH